MSTFFYCIFNPPLERECVLKGKSVFVKALADLEQNKNNIGIVIEIRLLIRCPPHLSKLLIDSC